MARNDLDLAWLDPSLGALQRRQPGVFTGLAQAIADRLGVDPVLVRVAFVVLALCGGLGVALYGWGSALTAGPDTRRPIDAYLPSFRGWPSPWAKAVVVTTTLAVMALTGAITPLPWLSGVALLGAFVIIRRTQTDTQQPSLTGHDAREIQNTPRDDHELIASWRASMAAAAGDARPLPAVELYGAPPLPEPRVGSSTVAPPRTSWGAGIATVIVMAAVAPAAYLIFGLSPLETLAASSASAGVVVAGVGMLTRRRVPRSVLSLVVVLAISSALMAVQTAAPVPAAADGVLNIRVVGERSELVLTADDLEGITTIDLDAVGSDVTVRLPGTIENLTVDRGFGVVTHSSGAPDDALEVAVVVDLIAARVHFEEVS